MDTHRELTDEQIEKYFDELGRGVSPQETVITADSFDDFKNAAKNHYREFSNILEEKLEDGTPVLIIEDAQLYKYQRRGDIVVLNLGVKRLVYSPLAIHDFKK